MVFLHIVKEVYLRNDSIINRNSNFGDNVFIQSKKLWKISFL